MSKQIRVTIGTDGTIEAETLGIVGLDCLDQVAVLEELLEATAVSSEFTADYHRSEDAVRPSVRDELG